MDVEPSASRQEIIDKFKEICAVNDEIAQSALAEKHWNLEAAVRVFLDGDDHHSHGDNADDDATGNDERFHEQNVANQNQPVVPANQRLGFLDWLTNLTLAPVKFIVWSLRFLFDFVYSLFGGPPLPMTDPRDEVRQFIREFREKYDATNAIPWLEMSYNAAINESRRQISYLLVYIHNPTHRLADEFARNYLLSPELSALTQQNHCLYWGASIRSSEGYKVCAALSDFNYPFIALLCMVDGRATCIYRVSGEFTLRSLIDGLQNACQSGRHILDRLNRERQEREMTSQLRREQETEYANALAADRAKAQERRRLESERLENQKREEELRKQEQQQLEELEKRRQEIRASLPAEPQPNTDNVVRVAVRFPAGAKLERRFSVDDSLELLFNVVFSNENCPKDFSLLSSYPRKELKCAPEWYKGFSSSDVFSASGHVPTFREAGFEGSLAVLVRDNEA